MTDPRSTGTPPAAGSRAPRTEPVPAAGGLDSSGGFPRVDGTLHPADAAHPVDGAPHPADATVLIEAKLAPPRLRRGVLPRDRLVRRLQRVAGGEVVTLFAPPGYGKTTCLALWRSREHRPVAWVTADEADADPIRLLTYVAVAIDRAVGLDPAVFGALGAAGASALGVGVPRLTTALHRDPSSLVLVVDDVHLLARTAAVDALAMLIDYAPPQVLVALAGRGDAGLPLPRYRVAGRLQQLGSDDLALDDAETARLVEREHRDLPPAAIHRLRERTEGWPAAVWLAARQPDGARWEDERVVAARGGGGELGSLASDPPAPNLQPTGARPGPEVERDLAAYLDAELVDRMRPTVRTFLLQASILDRLSGPLCDAVTGRTDSGRILRDLAAANALVSPLDGTGTWYRCHALLREHLLARLARTSADTAGLHRRAAAWYEQHDLAGLAVDHLFAAGDRDAAAGLMTGLALEAYRSGRVATLERWQAQLGNDDLRAHPYLAVIAALTGLLQGRTGDAERMLDIADGASYGPTRPEGASSFEAGRSLVRALVARRGLAAAVLDADRAVDQVAPDGQWRPIALVVLGAVLVVAGDPERGEAVLRDAAASAEAQRAGGAYAIAWSMRAFAAMEREDWQAAAAITRDGLDSEMHFNVEMDVTRAPATVAAARVALHHGDVAEARRWMATFSVARVALGPATAWLSARCLLEAATARLALADPAGARAELFLADDILARRPDLGDLRDRVATLRTRIRHLPPGPGGASTLTPAEVRVLRYLPTYLSASEIADRLGVAPNTVKTQVQAIYGKLAATSRSEAVQRATEIGLLEPLPVLAGADDRRGPRSPALDDDREGERALNPLSAAIPARADEVFRGRP